MPRTNGIYQRHVGENPFLDLDSESHIGRVEIILGVRPLLDEGERAYGQWTFFGTFFRSKISGCGI